MSKASLMLRYFSAFAKNTFVKPLSHPSAAKEFVASVVEYEFHKGIGRELESVSIHKVFPEISNLSWTTVGVLWSQETPYLVGALKALQAKKILEIGTFHGEMTLQMAVNLPDDGVIYTVDLDPAQLPEVTLKHSDFDRSLVEKKREKIGHLFHGSPHSKKIVKILHDSTTIDYSQYFDGCVDMAYVDGGHSYDQVKADTERVLKIVRKGGAIFWHDYQPGCGGVTQYLHELKKQYPIKHVFQTQLAVLRLPE